MPFYNQRNVLLYDRSENVYHFRWNEGKIQYTYFDQQLGRYNTSTLVEDCALEFDAVIDERDHIYFIYQRTDGNLLLMVYSGDEWNTSLLGEFQKGNIANLNILEHQGKIHILYCVSDDEENRLYHVYHHFYEEGSWKSNSLGEIRTKGILNPFQFIKHKEYLIFGFYNLVNQEEQIFIKWFNTIEAQWESTMRLTNNFNGKLYLDILVLKDGVLHLAYSEYVEGNLVIKYEKYKIEESKASKISEHVLSNPANASYPSFVAQADKLWVVWTEYDQVMSCFTVDQGLTWSQPYLWKETKEYKFFRYKFYTNNERIQNYYQLSHAFGKDYPEFSFVGFGDIQNAVEVPKKKEETGEEKNVFSYRQEGMNETKKEAAQKQNKDFQREWTREDLSRLFDRIETLEQRVQDIEDYLLRRRRGGLFYQNRR
ncbi:MAG TPA: hypothetical protein GX503_01935 [Clostridiales bacterium]|nr:hypothetical protein [Clostridiales bacterium]